MMTESLEPPIGCDRVFWWCDEPPTLTLPHKEGRGSDKDIDDRLRLTLSPFMGEGKGGGVSVWHRQKPQSPPTDSPIPASGLPLTDLGRKPTLSAETFPDLSRFSGPLVYGETSR